MTPEVIGIDIGGTKLLAVRLEPDGSVVAAPLKSSPKTGSELVSEVVAAARRLASGADIVLGLGVPGLVDATTTVRFAPNLHGVEGTNIGAGLREHLGEVPIWIGNDATAAAWAEFERGSGAEYDDLLMVTLGTGIGGGLVHDGKLFEGHNRFAGEFGHMVVDPNGPRCPCGKQGCWERYASGAGLGMLGREAAVAGEAPRLVDLAGNAESVRGEHVTAAAGEGDRSAIAILERFAWWVALGLANLTNILDPQAIVIGGGLIGAGDILMEPTRRAFEQLVEASSLRPPIPILAATLGPQAGAVGAALLAALVPTP